MKGLILVAAIFAVSPVMADEAVVVPDHHDTTVIHEHEVHHDNPGVVIEHKKPDAVIIDRDRHYSNGGSTGEVGVDVETHRHELPPDRR